MLAKPKPYVSAADWIGPRPDDPHPINYFSGWPYAAMISEEEFLARTGQRYRCISYAYCGRGSPRFTAKAEQSLQFLLTNGLRVMLDSGAHTFHNQIMGLSTGSRKPLRCSDERSANRKIYLEAVESFIQSYADFVKTHRGQFDFYVNFDYITHCPTIYKVLHQLQELGIRPMPVYHGDMSIDWMKRYIDEGHRLIGIGGTVGRKAPKIMAAYYDQVFNFAAKYGINLHGFAQTSPRLMFGYPWFSVDSTSWLKSAAFGRILIPVPGTSRERVKLVAPIVSDWRALKTLPDIDLRQEVERRGFDLDKLRTSCSERALFNAIIYVELSQGRVYEPRINWRPLV